MNYISQQEPNQMWIKKVLMLVLADILIVLISYFMALLLRFDFVFSSIPEEYLMGYLWSMPFWIISTIVIFYICRLYHSIWRLASVAELQMILIAYSILAVVYSLGMLFMQMHMPRSYYFIGFLLNFLMTTGLRFSYRLMRFWVNRRNTNADAGGEMHAKDHVMVIGAGAAGQALIKEIINSKKLNTQVVCIIDDNPTKHGRVLEGITIVGDRYSIPEMAKKYKVDRIIYAIPEAAADDRKAILNICKDTGCRLQTVPGVYQLVNGEVSVSRLRNVEITDLLGRAQVQVNMDEIYSSIQGKTLLVTGGGGSIGSELCRQIAASHPKKLIIFDMYENNAYEIQQELRRKYGDSLDLEVLIGSVRNTNRVRSIMQKYKPDVVFHAAAHKHVPLMEDSPNEAIKNNVMGTYKTAVAASRAGVKKFVLISTDKAVNPTNIMGASNIRRVLCPSKSAFSVYDKILRNVLEVHEKEELILIALGPTATILAYDLAEKGVQALDVGHIDIEYEWFLRKDRTHKKIEGKFVSEAQGGSEVSAVKEQAYVSQIVMKIENGGR